MAKQVQIEVKPSMFLDRGGVKDPETGKLPQYPAFQARLVSGRAYVNLSHARIDMLEALGVDPEPITVMREAVDHAEAETAKASPTMVVKATPKAGPVKVFKTFEAATAARTAARAK